MHLLQLALGFAMVAFAVALPLASQPRHIPADATGSSSPPPTEREVDINAANDQAAEAKTRRFIFPPEFRTSGSTDVPISLAEHQQEKRGFKPLPNPLHTFPIGKPNKKGTLSGFGWQPDGRGPSWP